MKTKKIIFFLLFLSAYQISDSKEKINMLPGIYQTTQYFPLLQGKTIGVVANQTSMVGRMHLVDTLKSSGFKIKCVFAPEHGFRGEMSAGEKVDNSIDKGTGIPIISLYGKHKELDKKDLKDIDVVVFDIQDVGVRFYTYISTLQYVMEACAQSNVQLIILDRPNPNSFYIDGPVLDRKFSSFVGMQPVPIVYGMTIGEYAGMLNGEGWLKNKVKCNLKVIRIREYYHIYKYQLPIAPSPNLPDMDAVYLYPSVCLFEGTSVSLGRGTSKPFRLIGYPDNEVKQVAFTPQEIPGVAKDPPYGDTICNGIDLSGEGKKVVMEKSIQLKWLIQSYSNYPKKDKFFNDFFDKLAGTDQLRKQIIENKSEEEIKKSWKEGIDQFLQIRQKYLLYYDYK